MLQRRHEKADILGETGAFTASVTALLKAAKTARKPKASPPLGRPGLAGIAPGVGVEMRPGDVVGHEALQEHRGGDAPAIGEPPALARSAMSLLSISS